MTSSKAISLFRPIILALSGCFLSLVCQGGIVTGLCNTGINNDRTIRQAGDLELHFSLQGPGTMDQGYIQLVAFHGPGNQAWVTPPAGTAWIGPSEEVTSFPNSPAGDYVYSTSFTVTGTDAASLTLTGAWASDDTSHIWLNGVDTGITKTSWEAFKVLTVFSLTGFVQGLNTLEFRVENADVVVPFNPSGLLVRFDLTGGTHGGEPFPQPVPEPSTFLAGCLVLLPFGGRLIRKALRRPEVQ